MDGIETNDPTAELRNGTASIVPANSTEDLTASNYADGGEDAVSLNNAALEILPGDLMNYVPALDGLFPNEFIVHSRKRNLPSVGDREEWRMT